MSAAAAIRSALQTLVSDMVTPDGRQFARVSKSQPDLSKPFKTLTAKAPTEAWIGARRCRAERLNGEGRVPAFLYWTYDIHFLLWTADWGAAQLLADDVGQGVIDLLLQHRKGGVELSTGVTIQRTEDLEIDWKPRVVAGEEYLEGIARVTLVEYAIYQLSIP